MKIGQDIWSRRGYPTTTENSFKVIGRPSLDGEKWVSIAPLAGGQVHSFPPEAFETLFRKVD